MTKINPNEYIKQFKQLAPDDILRAADSFPRLDHSGKNWLNAAEITEVIRHLGIPIPLQKVEQYIAEIDSNSDGLLDFGEFLTVFAREKQIESETDQTVTLKNLGQVRKVQGARGQSAYTPEEVAAYAEYLNTALAGDADLESRLPIGDTDESLFAAVKDGFLICKLANLIQPGCVDIRELATGKKLNTFSLLANCTLALKTANAIGCQTMNIGPADLRDGTPHLIHGLLWQMIRLQLLKNLGVTESPELYRVLRGGGSLVDYVRRSPEQILLQWLNYHLANAGSERVARNFTTDLADSEILATVLKQVAPECSLAPLEQPDLLQRAELLLVEADKIGCRKFVTPNEIVNGHPKLCMAFVANLFNTRPGIEELAEDEGTDLEESGKVVGWANERTREKGVEITGLNDPAVTSARPLLTLVDVIKPGTVDWDRFSENSENYNDNAVYALEVVRALGATVSAEPEDIVACNEQSILALYSSLMAITQS
jgi:hypothetical protein